MNSNYIIHTNRNDKFQMDSENKIAKMLAKSSQSDIQLIGWSADQLISQSVSQLVTHSLIHSLTHSLTLSLTHSLTLVYDRNNNKAIFKINI